MGSQGYPKPLAAIRSNDSNNNKAVKVDRCLNLSSHLKAVRADKRRSISSHHRVGKAAKADNTSPEVVAKVGNTSPEVVANPHPRQALHSTWVMS
jgi:hypothetical protein